MELWGLSTSVKFELEFVTFVRQIEEVCILGQICHQQVISQVLLHVQACFHFTLMSHTKSVNERKDLILQVTIFLLVRRNASYTKAYAESYCKHNWCLTMSVPMHPFVLPVPLLASAHPRPLTIMSGSVQSMKSQ